MVTPTDENARRAARALRAVQSISPDDADGLDVDEREDLVADLIAALLHLAAAWRLDIPRVLRCAVRDFTAAHATAVVVRETALPDCPGWDELYLRLRHQYTTRFPTLGDLVDAYLEDRLFGTHGVGPGVRRSVRQFLKRNGVPIPNEGGEDP
jgi:hypothetical protein